MEKHEIVLKKGGGGSEDHHQLGESALTCFNWEPHVDASRVQTVVTKRESESSRIVQDSER